MYMPSLPSGTTLETDADTMPGMRSSRSTMRQVEAAEIVRGLEAREVAEHLRRQHTVGLIPGLDALQAVEAGEEQPRADQQHDGHRHLRDDERTTAGAGAAGCRRSTAPACFSAAAGPGRATSAGSAPKARPVRIDRPSVNTSTVTSMWMSPVRAVKRPMNDVERAEHQPRHEQSPSTPPPRASSTLSVSSWPAELPASSAERHAQRQLALAMQRPRQRQARDVRAGEQQDEQRRAHASSVASDARCG